MTLQITGFRDLTDDIEEIVNQFDELSEKHGRGNVRSAIVRGVTSAFADISDEASVRAKRYVPDDHAERITHQSIGFEGDTYRHEMTSDSVIVASHEFGSGLHSINGRGTVDVPGEGYYIPKPRSKTTLRLRSHPMDSDESPMFADYVVHPGVRSKRFMYQALVQNEDLIVDRVHEQLDAVLEERGLS